MKEMLRKYRILVVPLDWGLGHATRSIPIIKELLANECEVLLAGEGMVRSHEIDAVISDNRFGLYHSKIPSIFITHQLSIKSPLGNWIEKILQRWNFKYINRFTECWIPDLLDEDNLAGELSHPFSQPKTALKYIGILSRFEKKESEEIKDHLLFILSGPEPQRTVLENKIINEVSHYEGTATIVRGLPTSSSIVPSTNMIKFYNHLPAKELSNEIQKADWVISRCGYSTVMDLVKLQKKMIMIPTPGQTEQEYLAKRLQQKQIAFTIRQKEFSLNMVLQEAKKLSYKFFSADSRDFQIVISDFIKK